MPAVAATAHKKGDYLVDYEEKVFEDVKAKPGEKALITFHTVAFEGSIGLVNILQALRLQRKGFKTTVLLYGPGVTLGVQRGFPKLGDEPFRQPADQIYERRWRNLLLPFRATNALRPRRGLAYSWYPAGQSTRRARSHSAPPARRRVHLEHVDALTPQRYQAENVGMTEKRVARAATAQIAPDLEICRGTVERVLATLAEATAYGQGEASLIPGVRPVSPLNVLDLVLPHGATARSS
jgi:hypothetical protein